MMFGNYYSKKERDRSSILIFYLFLNADIGAFKQVLKTQLGRI